MNDNDNIKKLDDLKKLSDCILDKMTEEVKRLECENTSLKTTLSTIQNLISEETVK